MYTKRIERLNEIAVKGLEWYGKDPRREFGNESFIAQTYTKEQRIALIATLIGVYNTLPIVKNEKYTIDGPNMEVWQKNIVKYATLDLGYKNLRGTVVKQKLMPRDLPYVNKWNPLLMYTLANKHNIPYEEWEMRDGNSQHLLGRDLKDLLVIIDYHDATQTHIKAKYYVSKIYKLMREEHQIPEGQNREEVTDNDENRINYNDSGNQIIRYCSPWSYAFHDEYPKNYKSIEPEYKLSEEFMSELVLSGITNKRPTNIIIPEGCEF